MKSTFWSACITALAFALSACESGPEMRQGQPLMVEAVVHSTQATIVGVNYETREVTLEVPNKPGDNFFDVTVGEEVENLSQIRFGDRVTVRYVEAVFVELFRPGQVDPGVGFATAIGTAPPHARPGRAVARTISVVATVEAIDKEDEVVSLRGPEGVVKTVKVRNPENLEMISVGDKVKTTFARALAIGVTPSPVG